MFLLHGMRKHFNMKDFWSVFPIFSEGLKFSVFVRNLVVSLLLILLTLHYDNLIACELEKDMR